MSTERRFFGGEQGIEDSKYPLREKFGTIIQGLIAENLAAAPEVPVADLMKQPEFRRKLKAAVAEWPSDQLEYVVFHGEVFSLDHETIEFLRSIMIARKRQEYEAEQSRLRKEVLANAKKKNKDNPLTGVNPYALRENIMFDPIQKKTDKPKNETPPDKDSIT